MEVKNLNSAENLMCMRGLIQYITNPFIEVFTALGVKLNAGGIPSYFDSLIPSIRRASSGVATLRPRRSARSAAISTIWALLLARTPFLM